MKRVKSVVCILLVLTMILSGCSGKKNEVETGSSNEGSNAKRENLVFAIYAEPKSLDPQHSNDLYSFAVQYQIFDTLIREEADGSLVPGLAESWDISEDGTEVIFHLKKDIKFHNGDIMTADDVAFSINEAIASSFTSRVTGSMDSAEKIDDLTVKLKLKHPYQPIEMCMCSANVSVVNKKVVEADRDGFGRNPVGTGPYKFVSWNSGEKIVLQRFDEYFRGPASIQDVTFRIIPDTSIGLVALENGEIDVLDNPPKIDKQNIINNEKLKYYETTQGNLTLLAFNNETGLFTNKKLRQAVSYAIDKEAIILGALEGQGVVIECPLTLDCFGYPEDFKGNGYDPEKAKKLLAEAGYPNGLTVKLQVIENSIYSKPTEVIQEQLRVVGINVELDIMERGAYLSDVYTDCKYDITVFGTASVVPDADAVMYPRFHGKMKGGGNNFYRCDIPELNELLEKGRISIDPVERKQIYYKAHEIIRDEAVMIPICNTIIAIAADKNLKGVNPNRIVKYHVYDYSW